MIIGKSFFLRYVSLLSLSISLTALPAIAMDKANQSKNDSSSGKDESRKPPSQSGASSASSSSASSAAPIASALVSPENLEARMVHKDFIQRRGRFVKTEFPLRQRPNGELYTEEFNPQVPQLESGFSGDEEIEMPQESILPETVLMRLVQGKDGRTPVENVNRWPYRVHAQLMIYFNGGSGGGSGTLVGPRHILTAGHNVYIEYPRGSGKRQWASRILVRPALNGRSLPYDQQTAIRAYTYQTWIHGNGDSNYDMALIILGEPIGSKIGWYGLFHYPQGNSFPKQITVTGYPKEARNTRFPDKETREGAEFKQMWEMSGEVEIAPFRLYYALDTSGGQSGGAIWHQDGNQSYIVGVHTSGEVAQNQGNFGVRLTKEKIQDITHLISRTYNIEQDEKEQEEQEQEAQKKS